MLYFYQPRVNLGDHFLSEDEYQHCVKVLRKKTGDEIGIFDGKGTACEAIITEVTSRQCVFEVRARHEFAPKPFHNHIAIAPTKNTDRLEWFVEKACELGVDEISFLLTSNCERTKLRTDRLEKKAVSALKQSKSGFLTVINPLIRLSEFLKAHQEPTHRLIAVVEPDLPYMALKAPSGARVVTLIGPEGDFTKGEMALATTSGFHKVSLGNSTLRTETAGLMAAHFVNVANSY